MLGKIILFGIAVTVGLVVITPMKTILAQLYSAMNSTFSLTDMESALWLAMPLILLVFIFVAAVWVFRGHGGNEGEE